MPGANKVQKRRVFYTILVSFDDLTQAPHCEHSTLTKPTQSTRFEANDP